jgi:ATP-dependent RNA helicase DeaD
MNKFEKLGLSPEVVSVLSHVDIVEPTEIQEKAIPLALAGNDIIGGSATGSGKTLAFASPIIENLKSNGRVQALILTPTRELAEQVADSIKGFSKNKSLNVLAVYGGVDIQRQIRKMSQTDILVGTPGRVLDHLNRRTLRLDKVNFLVLDEVDRMFDMGFQRDVENIIRECPKERQTMLFSATISSDIDYLAKKHTRNAKEVSVKSNVDPKKLKQVYYDVDTNKKFSLLMHLLKKEESDLVMVFCSTRRNTDFVAKNLCDLGIKAKAIHGGLVQAKRTRIISEFHEDRVSVLVCTDVAARGLDIKGVTHVYNYDLPKESKDYIHRIGRTARAGKNGTAINILSNRDYENFGNIVKREEVVISPLGLPKFERIMIKMDSSPRQDRFSRGPRSFGGRDSRRDNRPRKNNTWTSINKRSSNDSRPRRDSGSSYRGNRDSNRQDNRRSFGGRDSGSSYGGNRDSRPRRDSGSSYRGNRNFNDSRPRRDGQRSFGGKDNSSYRGNRDSPRQENKGSFGGKDNSSYRGNRDSPRQENKGSFGGRDNSSYRGNRSSNDSRPRRDSRGDNKSKSFRGNRDSRGSSNSRPKRSFQKRY